MRVAVTAIIPTLVCLGAYAAWPYASLYRIDRDVRRHDVAALTADVDWDSLRDGLKQDMADGITGVSSETTQVSAKAGADDDLPPFGSGFVTNLAGNVVDRTVTPEHLADTAALFKAAGASRMVVSRAFFTSPTSFVVAVRDGGAGKRPPALRLRLDLVRDRLALRWKVTRAWVPMEMLAATEAHPS